MAEDTKTFKCPDCGAKVLEKTGYCMSCKKKVKNESVKLDEAEKVDAKTIIKALGDTDWGDSNDAQFKAVQLLKGLSISDDPASNIFMKSLSDYSTKIAKTILDHGKDDKKEFKESYAVDYANSLLEGMDNMDAPTLSNSSKKSSTVNRACELL